MTPAFQGEVQFRRYSDTSTQGVQIVLSLAERAELERFIGKEGKRFMAVLVEIGDDEQPVQPPKEPIGPLCKWLVMRCAEPEFWVWVEQELATNGEVVNNADDAAAVVKSKLHIHSRKEIDADPQVENAFHQLIRQPFQRWLVRRGG